MPEDEWIEVDAVGNLEEFEGIVERRSNNIEIMDEQASGSLSDDLAGYQLLSLFAQQCRLFFKDGNRRN